MPNSTLPQLVSTQRVSTHLVSTHLVSTQRHSEDVNLTITPFTHKGRVVNQFFVIISKYSKVFMNCSALHSC